MPLGTDARPLKAFLDIRRGELPVALAMFAYFFLVITTFWILKPLKKATFIEYYDQQAIELFGLSLHAAQSELVAKVLNTAVAYAAVVAFSALSRRLVRHQLTNALSLFFGATFVLYAQLLDDPGSVTVWSFYLYGDLYSTLMVATFFAFLNDSVAPEAARRLYGLVVLGGVLGGVLGSMALSGLIDVLAPSHWMGVCLGLGALILAVANVAGRRVLAARARDGEEDPAGRDADGHPALAGARLVFRSPYLLSVVTIVGVYEIVSTIMDFQFSATIAHYLDGADIGRHFARVFLITNVVSMIVQLFVTGFVMTHFRLTVALLILPATTLLSSLAFVALPGLWIGSLLNTADNGFSYSVNQSAKEALYTPTSRAEKYRAKAFIDMFVQRFAKTLAVGVSLTVTLVFRDFSSVRWLGLATVALVLGWAAAAHYAGRRFHRMQQEAG
jgi:ATP:ADP antiporter, AAA family